MGKRNTMDATILATLPDYLREDVDVRDALERVDYAAFRRQVDLYPHPADQVDLLRAWNAIASERRAHRAQYAMICRECGAHGHTIDGLGVSCGCAAE